MSVYLRRGAEQSIAWRPFGAAAFAEARALGRPILLQLGTGFSSACRLLDAEVYEEPEAPACLAAFIAIRVDADERPELDARYQERAGSRGAVWPLAAVLTPAGRPYFVSAHLPRAGWLDRLHELAEDFAREGEAIAEKWPPPAAAASFAASFDERLRALELACDRHNGGFGFLPKLPHAPALGLLLDCGASWARAHAAHTLRAMADGGLHDQLGGGFHRYSTDDAWVVPHFEKRAGDQAALLELYARAAVVLGEPRLAEVARGIFAYVERRLAAPGGGFYAAEDAHLGPYEDGGAYTFSLEEARHALDPDELAAAQPYWDLYGRGEMHLDPTRNVLFVAAAPAAVARELGRAESEVRELLERARRKLLCAREARPRPEIDDSLYVAPNAQLARALIEADRSLGLPNARAAALATLARIYRQVSDGSVARRLDAELAPAGGLGDHAELGRAALIAAESDPGGDHRAVARAIAERLLSTFAGGQRDRPLGELFPDEPAPARMPVLDDFDGPGESAAAAAGRLLCEAARVFGESRYRQAALRLVEAALLRAPIGDPRSAGVVALSRSLDP